ncbi:MAG: PorT family protein [Bacteroidales bacterium]|nr:PorT family protein [Bacteroidales bacterium]
MKKVFIVLILMVLSFASYAQNNFKETFNSDLSIYKKFSIGTDFTYDFWLDQPSEMGNKTRFNRSSSFFATYNIRIKNSPFYFCPGLGMNFRNIYSSAFPQQDSITGIRYEPIPANVKYKKSKTTLSYIELPLEMRYSYNRFQVGIGLKISLNIGGTAKYKGNKFTTDDLIGDETGSLVKQKWNAIPERELWQFGAQLRIGYSWIHAYAYYGFSNVFKSKTNINMHPISVGITIMPFR